MSALVFARIVAALVEMGQRAPPDDRPRRGRPPKAR